MEYIYFSFNHRNKKKLVLAIWFSVQNKCINKAQLLAVVIKEIQWNLERSKYLGSVRDDKIKIGDYKGNIKLGVVTLDMVCECWIVMGQ